MAARARIILLAAAVQVVLFVASLGLPGLGAPGWHHLVSLALALVLLVPFRRELTSSRAFLGLGVFVTTVLAVGSGFFILYAKPWLKAHELVDWIKWWHVFWSWLGIAFFVQHTWINRVSLFHLWRNVRARAAPALVFWAGLLALLAAMAYPWTSWGKDAIGDPNYIGLTWYAWLVVVAPSYALWAGALAGRAWSPLSGLHAALPRLPVRGFVDVALVPVTALANLSGFPITFWKDEVHGAGFKFAGKWGHTAPSILMAVLLFGHVVHLWRPTRSHWRRWGRIASRSGGRT